MITEWGCREFTTGYICNTDEVKAFMKTSVDWFEGAGSEIVLRWAYFGAFRDMAAKDANGLLETNGKASAIGKYYASL
jgi:hypothetical protein